MQFKESMKLARVSKYLGCLIWWESGPKSYYDQELFLCSVTLAVTATWINSCLFLERTEYLCEIEQYYSINKRDGNLQRIDQKSWTIDLWTWHELDMSETCNGFYNTFLCKSWPHFGSSAIWWCLKTRPSVYEEVFINNEIDYL